MSSPFENLSGPGKALRTEGHLNVDERLVTDLRAACCVHPGEGAGLDQRQMSGLAEVVSGGDAFVLGTISILK